MHTIATHEVQPIQAALAQFRAKNAAQDALRIDNNRRLLECQQNAINASNLSPKDKRQRADAKVVACHEAAIQAMQRDAKRRGANGRAIIEDEFTADQLLLWDDMFSEDLAAADRAEDIIFRSGRAA